MAKYEKRTKIKLNKYKAMNKGRLVELKSLADLSRPGRVLNAVTPDLIKVASSN